MEVLLCDRTPDVVKAWRFFFERGGRAAIVEGNVLASDVQAVVVPTNSFCIMDGGLSAEVNKLTGGALETRARKLVQEKYAGELPVGISEVMSSGLEKPAFVVLSPTARVPQRLQSPGVSPYLATRGALRAVAAFLREGRNKGVNIDLVAFVGMGTGQGGYTPATAAFQMYEAYCQVVLGQLPNFATLEAALAHDQEFRKSRFL